LKLTERTLSLPVPETGSDLIEHFRNGAQFHLKSDDIPIRFVVSATEDNQFKCELGVITDAEKYAPVQNSLFEFNKRRSEDITSFNAVLLVPTGIGAEIGGHAGDATPVANMLAQNCDKLITHPNVVNASDINEMSDNMLYVEGSIISRMLMGTVGLKEVRSNRILFIIDDHPVTHFKHAAINSANAAKATYGLDIPEVVCINPSIHMTANYADSGRAIGTVSEIENCLDYLIDKSEEYDAVAFSSVIKVPYEYHLEYFSKGGEMINPWGGVEAILTHATSTILNVPTAHAPMFENKEIENLETGVVDPRMSAEAVSMCFIQCVLKGLKSSPRLVTDSAELSRSDIITAENVSCLIIPDGCIGLPTLAALYQGIPVIAVRENKNLMKNDLTQLPWQTGQLIYVESYLEAAGVMSALKAGISIESVQRPLKGTKVTHVELENSSSAKLSG